MEQMQDPLDISTGRIADALIAGSLINGAVTKDDVTAGVENGKGAVYEQVMEEVVSDDILILEGDIEEALKTEPINSDDRIAKALNAGVMKADEYIAEGRKAEARNDAAANIKTSIAEEMANETLIAKARNADLSITESILFDEIHAKFWKGKAMEYEASISEEWSSTAKDDERMDAIDNNSEATANEAINNKDMDDEPLIDDDRKFEATVAETLVDKAGNDKSILLKALVDEVFRGATTHDRGDGEAISIDRDQTTHNKDLRQKWLAQHKHFFNSPDSKLNLLKLWAESTQNFVEHLFKQAIEVQQLIERLQDLLQQLCEHNLEIGQDNFLEFKKKQLEDTPSIEYLDELLKQQYLDALQYQQPKAPERQGEKPKPVMSFLANGDGQVVIGPNGTTIAKTTIEAINWTLPASIVTRKLVMEVFGHETLASHSLTGKRSAAFLDCDKPKKGQLDPLKVADVTHFLTEHTDFTVKEVRNAITAKCADENKMHRQREKRRKIGALKLKPDSREAE